MTSRFFPPPSARMRPKQPAKPCTPVRFRSPPPTKRLDRVWTPHPSRVRFARSVAECVTRHIYESVRGQGACELSCLRTCCGSGHLGHAKLRCVLRLGTIVLGADDVERAVAFWVDVFGYEAVSFPGSDDDFTILVPPDRIGTRVAVHRSVTPVQDRPRVHLDLVVDNSAEQLREI